MTTAPILVCFAVKEEASAFRRLAGARPGLRILLTGMGRRNAEKALSGALSESRPSLVITAGFAGALLAELTTGKVVFDADQETGLEAALLAAGAHPVRFHCAERVVTTVAEKHALRAASGAEAVEMESGFMRRLCRERGIPAATVRVILDTFDEDLVLDFNQLMTAEQRIDGRKLALAVLKAPSKIPALLAFQKQSTAAAESLAKTLTQVLGLGLG